MIWKVLMEKFLGWEQDLFLEPSKGYKGIASL